MPLAMRSAFTASCLATLAASLIIPIDEKLSSRAPQASESSSDSSYEATSPTITFVSYITVSNGTVPVNPSTEYSLTKFTEPWTTQIATILCPNGPDCYDAKMPSKTGWMTAYADYFNPYGGYIAGFWDDPTLQDTCASIWDSSFFQYFSTAPWRSSWTPAMSDYAMVVTKPWSTYAETYPVPNYSNGLPAFSFTPPPLCCGHCSFTIGTAQVFRWPVSEELPLGVTTIVKSSFTFTSPSIYLAFETIGASDSCGEVGTGRAGSTIAFDASDISTANRYFVASTTTLLPELLNAWRPSYTQFDLSSVVSYCSDIVETFFYFSNYGKISNGPGPWTVTGTSFPPIDSPQTPSLYLTTFTGSLFVATHNPCYPLISAPRQILTLEPKWSSCRGLNGVNDPEVLLTTSAGMKPQSTSPSHPAIKGGLSAEAGPAVLPTTPVKTASPSLATSPPPDNSSPASISTHPPVVTIGGMTITANSDSALVVGLSTLKPGDQIIYSGTTIYMATDGSAIAVDGTTQNLNPIYVLGTQPLIAGTPVTTISGTTYFAAQETTGLVAAEVNSVFGFLPSEPVAQVPGAPNAPSGQKSWMSEYIVSGQTLIAGGTPITVSGTTMSLELGGSSIVVVFAATVTEDVSVLLGGSPSETSSSDPDREKGTTLNGCSLTTKSATASGKSRSGAPSSQLGAGEPWLFWVVLLMSCAKIAI